jgi:hypothetical protein
LPGSGEIVGLAPGAGDIPKPTPAPGEMPPLGWLCVGFVACPVPPVCAPVFPVLLFPDVPVVPVPVCAIAYEAAAAHVATIVINFAFIFVPSLDFSSQKRIV